MNYNFHTHTPMCGHASGSLESYIENAIDIVIQIDRLTDGKRKVTSISEVNELDNGNIIVKEIFSYIQTSTLDDGTVIGNFKKNRGIPKVIEKIKNRGIHEIDNIF